MSQLLPYAVSVWCSGGWRVLARFAGETDAYQYARHHIEVRIFERGTCIAEKRGHQWPITHPSHEACVIPMVTKIGHRDNVLAWDIPPPAC